MNRWEGMSRNEEYEYSMRSLATVAAGIESNVTSSERWEIVSSSFEDFESDKVYYLRNLGVKKNVHFESAFHDLERAQRLWKSGKMGGIYFFARLAMLKAEKKPKAFVDEDFVPRDAAKATDFIEWYFDDLLNLFYARKRSPACYAAAFQRCFALLRDTCENVRLLDESCRLYVDSVRFFECGKLDDATYIGADAFDLFQHIYGMRESFELGAYRKMYNFLLEDSNDLDGFDLLNGWKFTG